MCLVSSRVCSGNQTSQSLAVISDDNLTAFHRRGNQIREVIFGLVDVDFVNQDRDILGCEREAVNESPREFL